MRAANSVIFVLVLAFVSLVQCDEHAVDPSTYITTTAAPQPKFSEVLFAPYASKGLEGRAIDLVNAHLRFLRYTVALTSDTERFADLFAKNYRMFTTTTPERLLRMEDKLAMLASITAAFPDFAITPVEYLSVDNDRRQVVAKVLMTGTHRSKFTLLTGQVIEPTFKRIAVPALLLVTFDESVGMSGQRVAYEELYWDFSSFVTQLQ